MYRGRSRKVTVVRLAVITADMAAERELENPEDGYPTRRPRFSRPSHMRACAGG